MADDLYHARVFELAGNIRHSGRLSAPQGTATKVSRVCGSVVTVDVTLDDQDRITAFAIEPRACALGQAAAAILADQAIGAHVDEIMAAHAALRAMLKERAPPPGGRFWELAHLKGVADYPPRHASTLLAFDAAIAAIAAAKQPAAITD